MTAPSIKEALELKPCPFCGGEPDIRTRQDEDIWTHNTVTWTGVHCAECGISFDWPPGADPTAVEQWNTRATLSPPAGGFAKFANEQIDRISKPRARTKTVLALCKRLGMTKSTIHVYLRGEETFSAEQKEIAVEFFSEEQDKKKAAEERIGGAIRRLSQPEEVDQLREQLEGRAALVQSEDASRKRGE